MDKIKTEGAQILSVPNDEEGKAFMKQFDKYKNTAKYRFRKRGRGNSGKSGSVPKEKARWIAIYANGEKMISSYEAQLIAMKRQRLENTPVQSVSAPVISETQRFNEALKLSLDDLLYIVRTKIRAQSREIKYIKERYEND